jgi:hypothetical protein
MKVRVRIKGRRREFDGHEKPYRLLVDVREAGDLPSYFVFTEEGVVDLPAWGVGNDTYSFYGSYAECVAERRRILRQLEGLCQKWQGFFPEEDVEETYHLQDGRFERV